MAHDKYYMHLFNVNFENFLFNESYECQFGEKRNFISFNERVVEGRPLNLTVE